MLHYRNSLQSLCLGSILLKEVSRGQNKQLAPRTRWPMLEAHVYGAHGEVQITGSRIRVGALSQGFQACYGEIHHFGWGSSSHEQLHLRPTSVRPLDVLLIRIVLVWSARFLPCHVPGTLHQYHRRPYEANPGNQFLLLNVASRPASDTATRETHSSSSTGHP